MAFARGCKESIIVQTHKCSAYKQIVYDILTLLRNFSIVLEKLLKGKYYSNCGIGALAMFTS